ncbi:hypothetical protein J6590_068276 [Homalodisca vitripennis]|nr:hypothetical protein J6590_068276 [Homalodisca vitripennis]
MHSNVYHIGRTTHFTKALCAPDRVHDRSCGRSRVPDEVHVVLNLQLSVGDFCADSVVSVVSPTVSIQPIDVMISRS